MNSILDAITWFMNFLGDAVFAALSIFSPAVALVIISAVVGWLMLLIWRYTSNQAAIKQARNQIAAHLLSTRLFRDNLAVTFRAQRMIVWHALRLLGYSLKPMLIMLVPFVLVMAQIGLRYEFQPPRVGDVIRVTATLKPAASEEEFSQRLLGPGSQLEYKPEFQKKRHDPCRAAPIRTVDWRLTPLKPGRQVLLFGDDHDFVRLPVEVGENFARLSSIRGGSWYERLLYSGEPSIPAKSIFESIRVHYPPRSTPILGYDVHWLVTLFILSIVFALLLKPFMKVHI
ncbi:MAG TPA: hypothetical protein VNT79_06790 [Phycisphaerae bacterium]|nr:hypothetical protein [Phycisphaerae bacterium]